jgi:hypothetical protein
MAAAGSWLVAVAVVKLIVAAAGPVNCMGPELSCAKDQPSGYITDHGVAAPEEKV